MTAPTVKVIPRADPGIDPAIYPKAIYPKAGYPEAGAPRSRTLGSPLARSSLDRIQGAGRCEAHGGVAPDDDNNLPDHVMDPQFQRVSDA